MRNIKFNIFTIWSVPWMHLRMESQKAGLGRGQPGCHLVWHVSRQMLSGPLELSWVRESGQAFVYLWQLGAGRTVPCRWVGPCSCGTCAISGQISSKADNRGLSRSNNSQGQRSVFGTEGAPGQQWQCPSAPTQSHLFSVAAPGS